LEGPTNNIRESKQFNLQNRAMKKTPTLLAIAAIVLCLAGCASQNVAKPSAITLEAALKSVGQGLHDLNEAEGNIRTGLYPDSATVTFNIAASSTASSGLTIDLNASAGPQIPVSGTAAGSISNSSSGQRGNQITITFKNILNLNPTNSLASKPTDIQALLDIIKDPGNHGAVDLRSPTK
jgi:hypothetical protein